jgi:hypothetical protein
MNASVNRRVFVGSVAAGLPLLAGVVHGVRAGSSVVQGHDHTVTGVADPVFENGVRELAAIYTHIRSHKVAGDDARAAAAQMRTMLAYGRQIEIDRPAKNALDELVRRHGRDATLYLQADRTKARAHLKRYGVDAADQWFDTSRLDYDTRSRVLDALSTGGVTGLLARTAGAFDAIATELDKIGDQMARVRRVQYSDLNWYIGFCQQLQEEINRLTLDATIVCGASSFFPALDSVCGMITMAIGIDLAIQMAACR